MAFFFFPTGTDAPCYHWPFATVGIVLLNIVGFLLQCIFPESSQQFLLHYGSFNPIVWVTSIFMHLNVVHLIGNLICIGVFGWIVEGKIGWKRFSVIYLAIGAGTCAVEQLMMLFAAGGASFGASGVVFGLIAMSMVWAPENEITITSAYVFFFRPVVSSFEVSVLGYCFFSLAVEFLVLFLSNFAMSSAVLHLLGAVPGFVIAYHLLKSRKVDCEGHDLISILQGRRGERVLTVQEEQARKQQSLREKREAQREMETGLAMVDRYIESGHFDMAVQRFRLLRKKNRALKMEEEQYLTIIKAWDEEETTREKAVPIIEEYLRFYHRNQVSLRLRLARFYILTDERPRKGLRTLEILNGQEMSSRQVAFAQFLIARAKRSIDRGTLEVDE